MMKWILAVLLMTAGVAHAAEEATVFYPVTGYEVSVTSSEASQLLTSGQPGVVRLVATTGVFVAVSHISTTSAATAPMFLPGNEAEYLRIGRGTKAILAISAGTNGTLYIHEMD